MRKICHMASLCVLSAFLLFAKMSFANSIGFSCLSEHGHWQICVTEPGGNIRQLTKSPRDKKEFSYADKDRLFVYRTANAELHLFDMDSGEERRLLEKHGRLFDPALSPNGRELLFTRFRTDIPDSSDIWRFDFSTKKVKKLTSEPKLQYDATWSRDGGKIAFVSSAKNGGHEIRIMNIGNDKQEILTDNAAYNISPDWSPDDGKIVFASNIGGNYDIWMMDSNGKNKKKLTHDKGLDIQPVWSPDGGRILFVSNRMGDLQIWMMKADGSAQSPLTPNHMKCSDPEWLGFP